MAAWCVVANEIKVKSKGESNDRPKKVALHLSVYRRLSDEEVDIIIKNKVTFHKACSGH